MPRKSKYPSMSPEVSKALHRPLLFQQLEKSIEESDEVKMSDYSRVYLWGTPQEQKDWLEERGLDLVQYGINDENALMWAVIKKGDTSGS